jgi:hypothetical protein
MAEVYLEIPKPRIREGNYFVATAKFRDGDSSTTPTTARYRVDCLTTGDAVTAWTTITPATSASISIGPNTMQDNCNRYERRQVTVEADTGLTTQSRTTRVYRVENNLAFDE